MYLNSGRVMDALIAEQVMGFQPAAPFEPLAPRHSTSDRTDPQPTPHYSTSLDDAWKAVRRVEEGTGRRVSLFRGRIGYTALFAKVPDDDGPIDWRSPQQVRSDAPAHALCLAMFVALGLPIPLHADHARRHPL